MCTHEVADWNQVCLVESGADCHFHPLSFSHGRDKGLQHQLRLRLFERRNRESRHISLCLSLSLSLRLRLTLLLSVSLSLAETSTHAHLHEFGAGNSLKFLRKPQSSSFTHPTLIASRSLTCASIHAHPHCKDPVYLKELKRRPSSSVLLLLT